jgi:anti-anti-sigma factor
MAADFNLEQKGDRLYIYLIGSLDYEGTSEIRHRVIRSIETDASEIVLDLTKVDYLGEDGLGLILSVTQAARKNNKVCTYNDGPPQVRQKLRISGFDRLISKHGKHSSH